MILRWEKFTFTVPLSHVLMKQFYNKLMSLIGTDNYSVGLLSWNSMNIIILVICRKYTVNVYAKNIMKNSIV